MIILKALEGEALPIYGNGEQIRDWLFVEDHARALIVAAKQGKIGETYNIGGHNEIQNINVVKTICGILDNKVAEKPIGINRFEDLIEFVTDRPGHDVRYAIDASKIKRELDWSPQESFETGIEKTIDWYLEHKEWCDDIQSGKYQRDRLGILS